MILRLLRAPDLAFWTLAVLGLGALLVVAHKMGTDLARAEHVPAVAAVRTVTTTAAADHVRDIQGLMQAGTAAGVDPEALEAWAGQVSTLVDNALHVRRSEGAPETDELIVELTAMGADAGRMSQVSTDPVAATSLRTQMGLRASRLVALVTGLPAPGLPGASSDPLGLGSADLDPPAPTAPTVPSVPALPDHSPAPNSLELP